MNSSTNILATLARVNFDSSIIATDIGRFLTNIDNDFFRDNNIVTDKYFSSEVINKVELPPNVY